MIYIALVDDHVLLRQGLSQLIGSLPGFMVLFEADNGQDMISKLKRQALPDIILMDISMPVMDGYQSTNWLKVNYPEIRVIALSMLDDESAVMRMLHNGAKGFMLKNSNPVELETAIRDVAEKGFYVNDLVGKQLMNNLSTSDARSGEKPGLEFTARELQFLQLAATEKNYKEIADDMCLSPRTVEKFRDTLFEKFNVNGRLSLVLAALRDKYISL